MTRAWRRNAKQARDSSMGSAVPRQVIDVKVPESVAAHSAGALPAIACSELQQAVDRQNSIYKHPDRLPSTLDLLPNLWA